MPPAGQEPDRGDAVDPSPVRGGPVLEDQIMADKKKPAADKKKGGKEKK